MNTVRIYQLKSVSPTQFRRLRDAQMEAAQVWNCCMELHQAARLQHATWPGRDALQKATKGRFALYSQSVQMVVHAFLANIDTTRQLRQTHPQMRMRYPYKTKRFYPVHWPAQAVSRENGWVVLPMGRGRNMHKLAFNEQVKFPRSFTYLRPSVLGKVVVGPTRPNVV